MSVFYYFTDMLPEHKDVLMRDLVVTGDHCTAIMLASTCKQERARYARLGYQWPFAAARLSALRNDYVDLFKYLFEYCKRDRVFDREYMYRTLHVIGEGTNVELFKWYTGHGFSFEMATHGQYMSWNIVAAVVAEYMDQRQLHNILSYTHAKRWNLEPFYYMQKRFGLLEMTEASRAIGRSGTLTDVEQLGVDVLFKRPTIDIYPLIYAGIEANNSQLLHDIFEKWPATIQYIIETWRIEYMLGTQQLSVSIMEVFKRHGIAFDHKIVIKKFFNTAVRNHQENGELTPEIRALIDYGGWTLPDGVKTLRQINAWLSPDDEKNIPTVIYAVYCPSFLNAL